MLKNILPVIVTAALLSSCASSQLITSPSSTLRLQMEPGMGTNGASITYNPDKKLYYAVFAGNSRYPLQTFDANGTNMGTREAGQDMRGLWYNAATKELQGNTYNNQGLVKIPLTAGGIPEAQNTVLHEQDNAPTAQAVGDYDAKKKMLIYREGAKLMMYDIESADLIKSIDLAIPASSSQISTHNVFYTGAAGKEFAVYNFKQRQVYFFDYKGAHQGTVDLPKNAPTSENFNVGYANKHIFLFDTGNRVWMGYKVFE